LALPVRPSWPIQDSKSNEPQTFRSIIELWSTRKGMADAIAAVGANPGADAVSKWWRRNFIPPEWWSLICTTDVARAGGVTAELMARLAARTPVLASATAEART